MGDVLKFRTAAELEADPWQTLERLKRENPGIPFSPVPISVAFGLCGVDDGSDLVWEQSGMPDESGRAEFTGTEAGEAVDEVVKIVQGLLRCTPFANAKRRPVSE